jgi:fumarate reductase (CoM/CoB) subunit B
MRIKFKIFRFNPDLDARPYHQDFELDVANGMTILDCLIEIKNEQDGSLTFRRSCRSGICGSCSVRVNHRAMPACKTQALDVVIDGRVLVEPLVHLRPIKDLAVDMEPFYQTIENVQPWLVTDHTTEEIPAITSIDAEILNKVSDCIFCGACYSDCNVIDVDRSFAGPSAIAKTYRFACDPRDMLGSERIKQLVESGLYKCPVDQECEIACPKDISLRRDVIEQLRCTAVTGGFGPLPAHKRLIMSVLDTGASVPVTTTPAVDMYKDHEHDFHGIKELFIREFEGEPVAEVVLFFGCIINRRQQDTAAAIINIFQHNKVAVHIPKKQVCCGSPFMRVGMRETMKPFVTQNFEIFNTYANNGVTHILTSCSGCNSTFRHDYPALALEYGLNFDFEIYDVGEYMTMMDEDGTLDLKNMNNIPMKTMYHYPCHIRASDLDESIYVNLITKIPGIELVQVPSSGLCCGGGGGVRAAYPDISDKLAIRRMEIARDEGVDGLLTNCPFCILSFERGLDLKEGAGETMDFGIFDFYKIFSRAFGEDEMIKECY